MPPSHLNVGIQCRGEVPLFLGYGCQVLVDEILELEDSVGPNVTCGFIVHLPGVEVAVSCRRNIE